VRSELGLPISIGVARTKHLAKIASQVAKPDGLVIVDPGTELDFLHDLPVELMWGVGPVTKERLAAIGVRTIGQLANTPGWSLEPLLGPAASEKLTALAWNRDPRQIRTQRRARSAGAQSALGRKPAAERVIVPTMRHLADRVASRLRAKSRPGRTVTVRVRFADLRSITRSTTLDAPIASTVTLLPKSPKNWCARRSRITPMRRRSHCLRSRCRNSKSASTCNSNCRLRLTMTGTGPAPNEAWRAGWLTVPSTPSAIVSDGRQ